MTTAQEGVTQAINDYVAACNAGDVDAFMATIADDAVFMPPDHAPLDGHDAIRAWIQSDFFDPYEVKLDCAVDRIVAVGNEAYAVGTFTLELNPKAGGDAVSATGAFCNMFRDAGGGSWKYTYGIFNFHAPLG